MTNNEMKVLNTLTQLGIYYERIEHPPVYTVEEANRLVDNIDGIGCKNLFLKEKTDYYLAIMLDYKRANLKSFAKQLNITRLSFARDNEMYDILGLKPGEVSPFGLINDKDKVVKVVIDEEIEDLNQVSFHPNVNNSTLILKYKDFKKYLDWTGNEVERINM